LKYENWINVKNIDFFCYFMINFFLIFLKKKYRGLLLLNIIIIIWYF
jgi:hypothetical protein